MDKKDTADYKLLTKFLDQIVKRMDKFDVRKERDIFNRVILRDLKLKILDYRKELI